VAIWANEKLKKVAKAKPAESVNKDRWLLKY
jgi:hypothetical protein